MVQHDENGKHGDNGQNGPIGKNGQQLSKWSKMVYNCQNGLKWTKNGKKWPKWFKMVKIVKHGGPDLKWARPTGLSARKGGKDEVKRPVGASARSQTSGLIIIILIIVVAGPNVYRVSLDELISRNLHITSLISLAEIVMIFK